MSLPTTFSTINDDMLLLLPRVTAKNIIGQSTGRGMGETGMGMYVTLNHTTSGTLSAVEGWTRQHQVYDLKNLGI